MTFHMKISTHNIEQEIDMLTIYFFMNFHIHVVYMLLTNISKNLSWFSLFFIGLYLQ